MVNITLDALVNRWKTYFLKFFLAKPGQTKRSLLFKANQINQFYTKQRNQMQTKYLLIGVHRWYPFILSPCVQKENSPTSISQFPCCVFYENTHLNYGHSHSYLQMLIVNVTPDIFTVFVLRVSSICCHQFYTKALLSFSQSLLCRCLCN